MNEALELEPKQTALVIIDLQKAIVSRQTAPYAANEVVERSKSLAEALRAKGGLVVYVHVMIGDFLQLPVDEANPRSGDVPPDASDIVEAAGMQSGDLLISKRHWGAFAGTKLEDELRSRGIDTIVLTGIATNMGVESTLRQGTGLGFAFVAVEDACTTFNQEMQDFAFKSIFPRLSRVRTTAQVLEALEA